MRSEPDDIEDAAQEQALDESAVLSSLEIHASAELAATASGRTVAQQLTLWTLIGRALDTSTGVAQSDVAAVLAGERGVDTVGAAEQVIVHATWELDMAGRLEALDLSDELAGRSYSELDADGNVATVEPD